ncbi:MAG: bifunctional homocysteine S-methyltransferase/methylenetetrahydrofolate reductase [Anaerolineaceae bacterium]|nr:bifunctional homocysteine S-methyltransferase/methylenetetrahydrofolate reductase [Anaerolineaceae bacterium]
MSNKKTFKDLLTCNRPILSDGAMGTLLHQHGARIKGSFEALKLESPALVAQVHSDYINAGSQMIQTNTFGANRFKLAQHGLADKVTEINKAGVELARKVVSASFKDVLIAGDVGPLGVRLAPYGRVQPEQAREAFAEQIRALTAAGVDVLILETFADLYEIVEAISAAKDVAPQVPVIASMTFTRDNRTLLGDSPAKVARRIHAAGADVIGINCSGGPNQLLNLLKRMREAVPEGAFSVMPNAGWPQQVEGRIMYPAGPEYFGEYALSFWREGACVIGGCCGTTPEHIRSMAQAVESADPHEFERSRLEVSSTEPAKAEISQVPPTQLAQKLREGKFVIAVEMDPPRGLLTQKLLAGASLLAEAGADVIDVADSPMARMRMSPWAVCDLIQRKVGIETTLHFPTRGRNLLRVQGDLLASHAQDVRNVFVVMGDPTSIGDYPNAMDNYDLVPSGLIKLIKQGFNAGMDHAGADIGQPTNFFVGCALNLNPKNMEDELKNLRRKLNAGADFILTQPIYSVDLVEKFMVAYESSEGSKLPIPLLVGLLPLASLRHANFLQSEVPGISIPEFAFKQMADAGDHGAAAGVKLAAELSRNLAGLAQGIYLMPAFGRYDHAAEIIESIR